MSEDINKIVDELLNTESFDAVKKPVVPQPSEAPVPKAAAAPAQDDSVLPVQETPIPPAQDDDDEAQDDDIATAEEMAAEARRSAEKRARKKEHSEEAEDSFTEYLSSQDQVNPYLEPDPEIPWVRYEETPFLTRGCNHCPESYVPVSNTELCSCGKVTSCDWMRGIHRPGESPFDVVEVRFKNNRKDFFRLPDGLSVVEGDVVAVEGMPGHDVGIVSLTGEACRIQMRKKKVDPNADSVKRLFRRAKVVDIERWVESLKDEGPALQRTRHIAEDLGLVMKINDIEYQGDHSKAIFYYTADERVDFRNLIKVLAEEFKVRVEMKQIGVRQEAGKVGGIGTCGRELCCSTWLTNFKSVTTNAAKVQQILPNPQKLAGQCGKLKCCLNFEYDVYVDALKKFPPANTPIRFQKGLALYKKTDVFRGIMWYAYEGDNELYALPAEKVTEIIEMNRNQQYPDKMEDFQVELMSTSALQQETSTSEFEQELRRMADSEQNDKDKGDTRRNRDDNRRTPNDRRRENRDNHDSRDNRDNRDNRENREHREAPRDSREGGEHRHGAPAQQSKGPRNVTNARRGGDPKNGEHRRDNNHHPKPTTPQQ